MQFYVLLTVFQLYQDDWRVVMKRSFKPHLLPSMGLKPGTTRSAGQCLTELQGLLLSFETVYKYIYHKFILFQISLCMFFFLFFIYFFFFESSIFISSCKQLQIQILQSMIGIDCINLLSIVINCVYTFIVLRTLNRICLIVLMRIMIL